MNTQMPIMLIALTAVAIISGMVWLSRYDAGSIMPSARAILNQPPTISELEHGYKTDRVVASRYTSQALGQYISFAFPQDAYNSDAAELSDLIAVYGGWVFEGGGYPGAPLQAKFKDVTDKETANAKIKAILPDLTRLIAAIGARQPVPAGIATKLKQREDSLPKWPDTTPPDKSDSHWEFNNNVSVNGTPYKKVEVSPDHWQWQVDQKSVQIQMQYEEHRRDLFRALQTRVLTDQEMADVANYGTALNIEPNVSYYKDQKQKELNEAFLQQFRLRAAASH